MFHFLRAPRRGFTLQELAIGIAIVAILVALALSLFEDAVCKSRISEHTMLQSMRKLADVETTHGTIPDNPELCPDANPGKTARGGWVDNPRCAGFVRLGIRPDGDVRGSYRLTLTEGGACFRIDAIFDTDGDGAEATYSIDCRGAVTEPDPGSC